MQIKVQTNFPAVAEAFRKAPGQVNFAAMLALNATANKARDDVKARMRQVFDRPTPWVINSVRVERATKSQLVSVVEFKAGNQDDIGGKNHMIEPHIAGGKRRFKAMEGRLFSAGLLPAGWNVVPGGAAKLDAYGNMSRGQISQLLNVLGTYKEAGYNKADARTRARLAKGNAKKGVYGFVYWVNPVGGSGRGKHLQPGVYQRVATPFGSSLKPILIFVKRAQYRQRLPFLPIVQAAADKHFPAEFDKAFEAAMRTALLKTQGQLI